MLLLKVGHYYHEFSTNDVDVLKNFLNFPGKHLYWNLLFNKIPGLAYKFTTKKTSA